MTGVPTQPTTAQLEAIGNDASQLLTDDEALQTAQGNVASTASALASAQSDYNDALSAQAAATAKVVADYTQLTSDLAAAGVVVPASGSSSSGSQSSS
jgi:hypothetical protein